jgi:HSP20 family protein
MNQITKRQPFLSNLAELQETINRLFDPALIEQDEGFSKVLTSDWTPKIDVKDAGSNFIVTADVPGVDPKHIEVSVDGNILTIQGRKETKVKQVDKNYVRIERKKGSFYRSIALSQPVLSAKISAKSRNGVLEITLPKNKSGTKTKVKVIKEKK